MRAERKTKIIEILNFYSSMIGINSNEINPLITEMKMIRSSRSSIDDVDNVEKYMNYLCTEIGYSITDENNCSRMRELVAMRDVVSMVAFEKYSMSTIMVGMFFGKDRTSGNSIINRSKIRLETQDVLFMGYYNKLKECLKEKGND